MSQLEIDIQTETAAAESLQRAVRKAVEATLKHQHVERKVSLAILLTDDAKLRQLNRDFLGFDEPTDVLSFPAGESWPEAELYLGDIAISVPRAQRQAEARGHTLKDEISLLTVHGVLHLLDFDHQNQEETDLMGSIQSGILCGLGIDIEDPFQNDDGAI
jgi:probable rRNA maturation factor